MRPSPQAVALIRSKVTDWAPDDAAIAASLNAPDRPNPVPQPTVPKPFSSSGLMSLVVLPAGDPNAGQPDVTRLAKIYGRPAIVAFRDDCARQDRNAVAGWLQLAFLAGDVSQAQYAAMTAVLQATGPDPSWPARIGWAVATIGRPVDEDDVAASRPGV